MSFRSWSECRRASAREAFYGGCEGVFTREPDGVQTLGFGAFCQMPVAGEEEDLVALLGEIAEDFGGRFRAFLIEVH